jgi:lipoprotein-releasing system permease protein
MASRPGLIALFIVALLAMGLVLRRVQQRARSTEPLRVAGGVTAALVVVALLLGVGAGVGVYAWTQGLVPPVAALGNGAKMVTTGWQATVVRYAAAIAAGTGLVTALAALAPVMRLRGRLLSGAVRAVPWGLAALCGLGFLVLTIRAQSLPVLKGTRYILSHELVRFGALATGVVFLLAVLAALLPLLLNRLERRGFVPFVSARHVRATKSGFLTVISVLSICGVAVSSCALCSVVSIMGGFGQDLQRKILGNNAHITVDLPAQLEGFADYTPMVERIRMMPGVAAATPVVAGEGMASSNANTAGVLIRGVDPSTIGDVIDLVKNIEYGKLDYLVDETRLQSLPPDEPIGAGAGGEPYRRGADSSFVLGLDPAVRKAIGAPVYPGIIIGRELARTMHLMVGDEFTLVSPLGDLGPMGVLPRSRKFRVAAIFYSGMYEYDATHVYLRTDVAQKFFSLEGKATTIEIRTHNAENTMDMLPDVKQRVGDPRLRVRDWREMNRNLFSALKLERIATFIILSIAIAVASFCIICTLLLMVTEKGKEIAILKALGASDGDIRAIFISEGVIIGAIGTAFGVGTGMATTLGLKWFGVRLDPEVYYIDRLPVATNLGDYVMVAAAAMFICTIATIYPAAAASRLRPVEGLRYELNSWLWSRSRHCTSRTSTRVRPSRSSRESISRSRSARCSPSSANPAPARAR